MGLFIATLRYPILRKMKCIHQKLICIPMVIVRITHFDLSELIEMAGITKRESKHADKKKISMDGCTK